MRLLTAKDLAVKALRKVGSFAPHDEGPDPDELAIALESLDMLVGQLAGSMRLWFLVPEEFTVPLTGGTGSYNLRDVLGSAWPQDGIQFVISAWLQPPNGAQRRPLYLARREEYQAKELLTQAGDPCMIYVDRRDPPTLKTWPVLGADLTDYSIKIVGQQFSPDLTLNQGAQAHGLPQAWQRWGTYACASDIGDGEVVKLSDGDLTRFDRKAEKAFLDLRTYSGTERRATSFVRYRDV